MKGFKSRKFLTAILTLVLIVLQDAFGIDPEQVGALVATAVGYIIGEAATDVAAIVRKPPQVYEVVTDDDPVAFTDLG